jgi:hypothetical protein
MANTVPSICVAAACSRPTPPPIAGKPIAVGNSLTGGADRIALQNNNRLAGLLTVGAVSALQLVPGVVEAEGATGAATTIGIGVRAAAANPVVKAVLAAGAGAAGSYLKSLVHDAATGQPALQGIADFRDSFNALVHVSLGIPQIDAR